MEYHFVTRLNGNMSLTHAFHADSSLQRNNSLYKFIWIQNGTLTLEIDHIIITLNQDEMISLTPLHHIEIKEINGKYLTLLFNSNFYCIYGHDNEVSCNGFLFNGGFQIMKLQLTQDQSSQLKELTDKLAGEYRIKDNLQEEMLRILLKRFIITCTRIAKDKYAISREKEKNFDLIRQFYVLVDRHFKEKKKVQEYAELLFRSPKTLSNLFAAYHIPTPLRIIHERIETEAKRLLLYTSKNAKEIADILGFEDLSAFSRFFKNMTGESISSYRQREIGKN
ncbi:AraC family transcriptional regulator [Gabonibacter massiliensis]|uniref:AraC family transcriptional regulator n=1 Tax=Gabonibacter massiliensis TaxID=1720195 RepID=UPI00073E551C|nr:helix-turn-helix domain-containing protein [Gabonibacter massiliensis]